VVVNAVDDLLDSLPKPKRRDPDTLSSAVERAVRAEVQRAWGKKPVCKVLVVEV
jgi:ribonuclease J